MNILDLLCDTQEEKQNIINSMELETKLTKEHLLCGDIPMPDGSWKSKPGNSRYECFLRKVLNEKN